MLIVVPTIPSGVLYQSVHGVAGDGRRHPQSRLAPGTTRKLVQTGTDDKGQKLCGATQAHHHARQRPHRIVAVATRLELVRGRTATKNIVRGPASALDATDAERAPRG